MAFDLTQRPFEGPMDERAKRLSDEAIKTKQTRSLSCGTRNGWLTMIFTPTGRVRITWRDRGGIKEGWFVKDLTIKTTCRKMKELLNS